VAVLIDRAMLNVPPAAVYRLTRRIRDKTNTMEGAAIQEMSASGHKRRCDPEQLPGLPTGIVWIPSQSDSSGSGKPGSPTRDGKRARPAWPRLNVSTPETRLTFRTSNR
jgi:hypothetical protein